MRKAKRCLCVLLALVLVLTASACSSADRFAPVVDDERIVRVCTTLPASIYTPLLRAYAATTGYYPVVTNVTPSELAGAFASDDYDVFLGGGSEYYQQNESAFLSIDIPEDIYEEFRSADSRWVGFMTNPIVFLYSIPEGKTRDDAPLTWQSLLERYGTSEIALADPTRSDEALIALIGCMQNVQPRSDVNRFLTRVFESGTTSLFRTVEEVAEGVANRRLRVGVTTERAAWDYYTDELRDELYIVYPRDSTIAVTDTAAISVNVHNSRGANTLINFLIGTDTQRYLCEICGIRTVNRAVTIPEQYWQYEAWRVVGSGADVKPVKVRLITPYDPTWVYEQKKSILSRWEELLALR